MNYSKKSNLIMPNISPDVYMRRPKSVSNKKKVLWVANIKEQKGPDIFLKLAKEFSSHKNIEFHMAGKVLSRYDEEIKAKADNAENLVYHGELPLDEINRLMSKAHLFVNTSKYEGFPNTFIQAWMNKTPVLSLNVDPDDIIERNGLGKLCGDFNTLKATIERMIQTYKQLASNAAPLR
jgi:glycosyltransferase involved in cell wall biosynthesis